MKTLGVVSILALVFTPLLVSNAHAAQLKIYRFTNNFVSCVKAHADEARNYTQSGVADSSLMNGASVLDPANLDGSYWNYMNCLTLSSGGTRSGNVAVGTTCPSLEFSVAGRRFNVPSGPNGKIIGIAGKFWKCNGGSWSSTSRETPNPNGGPTSAPTIYENDTCNPKVVIKNQCRFVLPATQHGFTARDYAGSYYGDDFTNYHGVSSGRCVNGQFEDISSTCDLDTCNEGERVYWSQVNSSNNGGQSEDVVSRCEGDVNFNGSVSVTNGDIKYFPTEEMARKRTIINVGVGQFNCKDGQWRANNSQSSCRTKTTDQLDCNSMTTPNGQLQHFCR